MSKAAAVREYLNEHPTAKAKEVVESLAAKKIKVSPTQVYGLMSKPKNTKTNGTSNGTTSIEQLIQAKKLVDSIGGVENARAALNALAKILA